MSLELPEIQKNGPTPAITGSQGRWPALEKSWSAVPGFLKTKNLWAALLLLAILLAFYRDVAFFGRTFLMENLTAGTMPSTEGSGPYGYQDSASATLRRAALDGGTIAWENEPAHYTAARYFKNGEFPAWEPNSGLGSPFLADGGSALLDPLQAVAYLLPESWWPTWMDVELLLRFYLAGFFTYLFIQALGLGFFPALFAGVAFMLAEHFIIFGNHSQLRAALLIPLVVYGFERLSRKFNRANFAWCVLTMTWALLTSFPESQFFTLQLGGLWYLYRAAWQIGEVRFNWRVSLRLAGRLALALITGLALSSIVLLPLAENIANAIHVHEAGTGRQAVGSETLLRGLLFKDFANNNFIPSFYFSVVLLAVIGLLAATRLGRMGRPAYFFGAYGLLFYLKLYGAPPVQWIGDLPLYSQTSLANYPIPAISFSFAVVAAFAVEYAGVKRPSRWIVLIGTGLPVAGMAYFFFWGAPPNYPAAKINAALLFGAELLLEIWLIFGVSYFFRRYRPYLGGLLVLVLLLEVGVIHQGKIVRPQRYPPYTVPPFVDYLRQQEQPLRIFGAGEILYPQVGRAYGLDDLRYLQPLLSERRFLYITQFISPRNVIPDRLLQPGETVSQLTMERIRQVFQTYPDENYKYGDIVELIEHVSRFNETETPILYSRYLDLLNVKYVLTERNQRPRTQVDLLSYPVVSRRLLEKKAAGQLEKTLGINNDIRQAVVMPAPNQLDLPILLPTGHLKFSFGIGLDPTTWNGSPVGDGVGFRVRLTDATGQHEVFYRYIDPKHNPTEQRWNDNEIDLSQWSGQKVILQLLTDNGPAGDRRDDIAVWSSPVISPQELVPPWVAQLTPPENENKVNLINLLLTQNASKNSSQFGPSGIKLANQVRQTLFMHAENQAAAVVELPADQSPTSRTLSSPLQLKFGIGIDPGSWAEAEQIIGDGVEFGIDLKDASGTTTQIYRRYLDPKHNKAERVWRDETLDLSQWRGQKVQLLFSTNGGPLHDTSADWAHWGGITLLGQGVGRLNPNPTLTSHFELVNELNGVRFFRNNYAAPRAFVLHSVQMVADPGEAIRVMSQADFDPTRQLVLERPVGGPALAVTAANLVGRTPPPADQSDFSPAQVISRSANRMVVTTSLSEPGVLLVSESYAPGWKVKVDGQTSDLLIADVFLRGVYLGVGSHEIEFLYQPASLVVGASLSGIALVGLIIGYSFGMFRERRSRRGEWKTGKQD